MQLAPRSLRRNKSRDLKKILKKVCNSPPLLPSFFLCDGGGGGVFVFFEKRPPPPSRFLNVAVGLDGDRLASISSVNLVQTLGAASASTPPSSTMPPARPAAAAAESGTAGGGKARAPPVEGSIDFSPPQTNPRERRVVGACFHELKARAMAVAAVDASREKTPVRTGGAPGEEEEKDEEEEEEWGGEGGNADAPPLEGVVAAGVVGAAAGNSSAVAAGAVSSGCGAIGAGSGALPGGGFSGRTAASSPDDNGGGSNRENDSENRHEGGLTRTGLEPWVIPLVTRPEGFLIEVDGVVLRAGHGKVLGKRLGCLALQLKALGVALAELPGR